MSVLQWLDAALAVSSHKNFVYIDISVFSSGRPVERIGKRLLTKSLSEWLFAVRYKQSVLSYRRRQPRLVARFAGVGYRLQGLFSFSLFLVFLFFYTMTFPPFFLFLFLNQFHHLLGLPATKMAPSSLAASWLWATVPRLIVRHRCHTVTLFLPLHVELTSDTSDIYCLDAGSTNVDQSVVDALSPPAPWNLELPPIALASWHRAWSEKSKHITRQRAEDAQSIAVLGNSRWMHPLSHAKPLGSAFCNNMEREGRHARVYLPRKPSRKPPKITSFLVVLTAMDKCGAMAGPIAAISSLVCTV